MPRVAIAENLGRALIDGSTHFNGNIIDQQNVKFLQHFIINDYQLKTSLTFRRPIISVKASPECRGKVKSVHFFCMFVTV